MLHYHKTGVTLTMNFSHSEIAFFQEGVAGLLSQLADTTQQYPVREEMLSALARILSASAMTESQHRAIGEGLAPVGKVPNTRHPAHALNGATA